MSLEQNKQNAIAFYQMAYDDDPAKAIELIEFVRCTTEGDLVALHTHQTWPGNDQYVTMDFFRFDENGEICEHWDAIQQVPEKSANPNTMY